MTRNCTNARVLGPQLATLGGRWVAIRDNHVIAEAGTLGELIGDERVERTDTRMFVPRPRHIRRS